jgi:hypothetical protein
MVSMRRALLIGVNSYQAVPSLAACVADAQAMGVALGRHKDGKINYSCRSLLDRMENGQEITRPNLRQACQELFEFDGDVLLYFSGHGVLTNVGGYLCTSDAQKNDWGIPMQEIVDLAARSRARELLLILDCCHSGDVANPALLSGRGGSNPLAVLREGMTVIAASRDQQVSIEEGGHGLFTAAVLDALEGGAADHMGWVTAPAIYAYVSRRFGGWDQRPVYKSNVVDVSVVRECEALIDRLKLHRLVELFPMVDYRYRLDPEYEPEDEFGNVKQPVNEMKVEVAQLFKSYRDAGLLRPSDPKQQLYWTARKKGTVELTPRGKEYWWLVKNDKI